MRGSGLPGPPTKPSSKSGGTSEKQVEVYAYPIERQAFVATQRVISFGCVALKHVRHGHSVKPTPSSSPFAPKFGRFPGRSSLEIVPSSRCEFKLRHNLWSSSRVCNFSATKFISVMGFPSD
jgi:hypothetical protein